MHLAPRLLGLAARGRRARTAGLGILAQLNVAYRASPASTEGVPRLRHGPRAGDRLPDAPVAVDGRPGTLHHALTPTRLHLLLIGPARAWPAGVTGPLDGRAAGIVDIHRLSRRPEPGAIHDVDGSAHRRLGATRAGQVSHWLIRPDGHIAYRAAGTDLRGLQDYLGRWLARPSP